MLEVGRQRKNLICFPDVGAGGWQTTEKSIIKWECLMLRQDIPILNFAKGWLHEQKEGYDKYVTIDKYDKTIKIENITGIGNYAAIS